MTKSTNPVILGIKLFGVQLAMIFASILLMGSFTGFISSNSGMKIYSSFTAFIFLSVYYSTVWNAGKKDMKHVKIYNNHNENKILISYKKCIPVAIISALPNIIVLIAVTIKGTHGLENVILRILYSSFLGWLGNDSLTYIPNCIIVTLIPMLLTFPAYIAGTKEFSLADKYLPKIIYKSPDKKNKNK